MIQMDRREVKTALKRMAFYYLLLAVCTVLYALIPDRFPARNISTPFLLTLSVCLVLYYSHRVSPTGVLSAMMKAISWMALLLILLRGIKYSVFSEVGVIARHTWYLYYVPMLLIPQFLFYVALFVSPNRSRILRVWHLTLGVSVLLICLVLTNDLHQLVFRFQPGFINWNGDYSHGLLFYAVTLWQYALYAAAVFILIFKCRIGSSRKSAWIILIPFAVGIVMSVQLAVVSMPMISGAHIIEFPEALILMVAVVLECCMQLGLIPTNTEYGKLFRHFSISAQITDKSGAAVYASDSAVSLSSEQFALPNGSRIGEHTVLRRMALPGGFGFWQDDMTELDRLNLELAEAKEELSQEAELSRLRNELKERQAKIEHRTLVYDTIAKRTQRQSQLISHLAKRARLSPDAAQKVKCRKKIALLAAYIKRFANLSLLAQEERLIEVGELGLSVSEVLRYLNFCGTPGEFLQSGSGAVAAEAALAVFEAFEAMLEANASCLRGVFANLSAQKEITLKLTFEALSEPLSGEAADKLNSLGVQTEVKCEDDVTFICFTLPKGGDGV